MAEKETKANAEAKDQEESKKGGGMMKMVLFIGVPILLVQIVIGYFVISKLSTPATEVVVEEEVAEKPLLLHKVEDIIINPAGSRGKRFLNTSLALGFTDETLVPELVEKEVQIRDALINVFVSKTMQELDGVSQKDSLRVEIIRKCNMLLKGGELSEVFFTNFVMQ